MFRCEGKTYCKSNEEIDDFIEKIAALIVYYNTEIYKPDYYDESVITKSGNFFMIPIKNKGMSLEIQ